MLGMRGLTNKGIEIPIGKEVCSNQESVGDNVQCAQNASPTPSLVEPSPGQAYASAPNRFSKPGGSARLHQLVETARKPNCISGSMGKSFPVRAQSADNAALCLHPLVDAPGSRFLPCLATRSKRLGSLRCN